MATALIASLFITIGWIAIHLFVVHQKPCEHQLRGMTFSFLGSLPVLFLFLFFLQHDRTLVSQLNGNETSLIAYCYAFLLQLLFFFFFVECFYHIERSVTLRLLIEINEAEKPLNIEKMETAYSLDDMIARRLEDMLKSGFVFRQADRWTLTKKAFWLAKIMTFSCWLFQSQPQNERL